MIDIFGNDMIDIFKQQPNIGEVVCCHVEFWHYGKMHHTEMKLAKYLGWFKLGNHPIFDIETYDDAYALVTFWRRRHIFEGIFNTKYRFYFRNFSHTVDIKTGQLAQAIKECKPERIERIVSEEAA